jgi:methyl-accepting chemotaxis protein
MKLAICFAAIVLFNICFGLYAIRSLSIINGRVVEADSWTVGVAELASLQDNVSTVRRYDLSYVIQQGIPESAETLRLREAALQSAESGMSAYRYDVETIEYDTEEQRAQDLEAIDAVISRWNAYKEFSRQILEHCDAGRYEDAASLVREESLESYAKLEETLLSIVEFNTKGSAAVKVMSYDIYAATRQTIIVLLLVVSVISIVVPSLLVNGIQRSIRELLRVSKAIGEGDLRVSSSIDSGDEFGVLSRQYNITISNIKSLIIRMQESAERLSVSAGDFSSNSLHAAEGTAVIANNAEKVARELDKQRAKIESMTSIIQEMSTDITKMTDSMDALANGAHKSVEIARDGGLSMESAIAQMDIVETAVEESSQVVTALGERSSEIGRIVGTIADISRQTNLLALNAAIEAARAGEQGRGFAVVADEVKTLAGESQSAAEEISRLISSIQEETRKAVSSMEAGREEVKKGSTAMSTGGLAFRSLAEMSVESASRIEEISAMTHAMADETSLVSEAANDVESTGLEISQDSESIAAATQQQTASMTEVSRDSQSLTEIAAEMLGSARSFSVQD